MDEDLLAGPAVELARMVRERQVSPVELTRAALERIDRHDKALGSFVAIDADGALATARAQERLAGSEDAPPLLGVPTAIKDLHLTAGLRTTFGTASLRDFVPDVDEESVARLRRAGFVILGKTNVPEFGTVPYTESQLLGPARTPWDPERSAGGSSGGAAAAVAAGFVPVAHGSDGAGSIRIPASACGVFGLKPARGRVSQAPLLGEPIGGLSTTGPLSRHVVDAAAMLDAMRGYAPGDPNWAPPPARPFVDEAGEDPPPLRVGLVESTELQAFSGEALRATREAAELLARLGHEVAPLELPVTRALVADFTVLWTTRVAALPVDPATLEPFNQDLHAWGSAHSGADVVAALNAVHLHARGIVRAALACDVILAPTLTRPPLRVGELAALDSEAAYAANIDYVGITPVANITGQPAMSVPLGSSDDGLPIGVQFVGRPADEATLLRLGGQLQRAADWTDRRPPLG